MANTRISDLTASASNLASTDLAPVVQTVGVGPVKMTGLQLAGGLLGSTTFNGSTVATSSPVLNLTQTWNDGAVTFTGLKFNATDTASASSSLLLDLQVGGTSRFSVTKSGGASLSAYLSLGANGTTPGITVPLAGQLVFDVNGATRAIFDTNGFRAASNGTFSFSSSTNPFSNFGDTILSRAAAATLQLGAADAAAPVAQTLQVQSVSAGTSNTAGANFTINGSKGTGTGAGGSIIFQVAPAGSSGTAQNAYSTALTIAGTRAATFASSIALNGALTFTTDNSFDIGASGATRPANGYFGTQVRIGSPSAAAIASVGTGVISSTSSAGAGSFENTSANSITSGASIALQQNSGVALSSGDRLGQLIFAGISANSATTFRNVASVSCFANQNWVDGSAYGSRLEFQITTNSATSRTTKLIIGNSGVITFGATEANTVPALKPSSTTLQVRLGDDSAFTDISSRGVIHNGVTFANLPGTPTIGTVAYVTDASNAGAAWGDSVTAGGSTNKYLVWYNGTNWTVVGK